MAVCILKFIIIAAISWPPPLILIFKSAPFFHSLAVFVLLGTLADFLLTFLLIYTDTMMIIDETYKCIVYDLLQYYCDTLIERTLF